MTETELTPELRDTLLREDAAIERCAKAAAWDGRPIAPGEGVDCEVWWNMLGPITQRLWQRRARVIIETWEIAR